MSERSLYERLGGESTIHRIAGTLFDLHSENPAIQARYQDSDRDALVRTVTEFICAGTGGPQAYTGKDMLETHRGMNISATEFLAVLDDIVAALEAHGVGEREQQEMLMIAYRMKGEIVHV